MLGFNLVSVVCGLRRKKIKDCLDEFCKVFSTKKGMNHFAWSQIYTTSSRSPIENKPYIYDVVKQGIIHYNIRKILVYEIIELIDSHFVSSFAQCKNKNFNSANNLEACMFPIG